MKFKVFYFELPIIDPSIRFLYSIDTGRFRTSWEMDKLEYVDNYESKLTGIIEHQFKRTPESIEFIKCEIKPIG